MTAAERTADEAARAQDMLNSIIARIDAALAFMKQRKAAYLPGIYQALETALNGHRNKALWYLDLPHCGGKTALGMMGRNGRGPLIDRDIASVDFHANRVSYVPPALRQEKAA